MGLAFDLGAVPNDAGGVLSTLKEQGAVVIRKFISTNDVDAINAELDPYISKRSGGMRREDDLFYGTNTVRIQALAAKSPTFIDAILLSTLMKSIADEVLLPNCGMYWMSQAETIFIGPNRPAQELHRDDLNWSVAQKIGIDLQVSVLVALGDYDAEVGATMVIPGSHKVPLDQPIKAVDAVPVELLPGDALVYLGSVIHGGGANRTNERVRKALYMGLLVGWLTPEEAVPLGVPESLARGLPERARELLGWGRIRGNRDGVGAASALQLWQLDNGDHRKVANTFV